MKNSVKLNGILFTVFATITILIYSCSSDTVTNATTANISGTITFVDTSKVQCTPTCGFYEIAAFSNWPPTGAPTAYSTLNLTKSSNIYSSNYQLVGLPIGGHFVLVAAFTDLPYHSNGNFVLGVHGCDTSESCYLLNPTQDTIHSSSGLTNINFRAFIDTSDSHVTF